ncbi:MAG TPA: translocation/assembly module TamB domain-containing protein, partial [Blastocatellia bacterium]|nr:translocation/assembly module TamB domain-containing protein [Blastocatellia bacterium]
LQAIADGNFTLTGTPEGQLLSGTVTIPEAEYLTEFDLGEMVSKRGGGLDFGGGGGEPASSSGLMPPIGLNIKISATDAILIRNEQVNTAATALLNIGGTASDPDINGRVTLDGGTIKFRDQRYEITTATLSLPGGAGSNPYLRLLAEGEVSGYRVNISFQGPIDDLEVNLNSEPQLTRTEILSLITTGRVDSGTMNSQDVLNSGIDTAASLLTRQLLSAPAEQLLGLSRFQLDPIIRPNSNPAARLTIGRQLARNFSVLYSTNLSSEQDQTIMTEYDITSRFSAVASFTQGGAGRVDQQSNEFTIEVRGRKRFGLGPHDRIESSGLAAKASSSERPPRPSADVAVDRPDGLKISRNRLRELLPIMHEGFSRALTRLGERNLTNYLQEKGYFFANVDSTCEPADCSGPNLHVKYSVDPGPRYDLKEIRIEGTDMVKKADLELESQEDSFLGSVPFLQNLPLVGGYARGLTSNDRLRRDRETIRQQLADLGFRSARVRTRLAVTPDDENLIVIFTAEPGPRAVVTDIMVRGNAMLANGELTAAAPVKAGQFYSLTKLREGTQQINRLYANHGYLNAATEMSVTDLSEDRVRVIYTVTEGNPSVIHDVVVNGLTLTDEDALRRFLTFTPGETLTPDKIRRTQRALYATGAFSEVNIDTEPVPGGDESARRVKVQVTESKPIQLIYGAGYSTDEGPSGLAELSHNNLFGRIHSASLRMRVSRRDQFAQFQYGDLRPFGHAWPVVFSIFHDRDADLRTFVRRQVVDGETQSSTPGRSFGLNRFGTFVQAERRLRDRSSLRFRYSFENAKLFNLENIPELEVTRNERAVRLGMLTVGFSRDSRDSALNPTTGQLFSADYSLATRVLGGNESFNKLFGNYQRYYRLPEQMPVLGNSVLAFSGRVGLAAPFRVTDRDGDGVITDPERQLPISERFFAGGATTLRGFKFEEAGPQGVLEPRTPNELPTLVPLGGDALTVFNFEFRYPLTRRLQLVPFYDLGNVFRKVGDIGFSGMTNTVGLGLRFRTPIGPVGIDYGYLLDPPGFPSATGAVIRQPRGAFHIRFGQNF